MGSGQLSMYCKFPNQTLVDEIDRFSNGMFRHHLDTRPGLDRVKSVSLVAGKGTRTRVLRQMRFVLNQKKLKLKGVLS